MVNKFDMFEKALNQEWLIFKGSVFKPVLGIFRYSDGHIEAVHTMGRFKLLMKVPDVELVKDLRNK